jgi:hypothetical protein
MRRSETALNFASGTNHELANFFTLFEGFFGFGGSPGRSGDHASLHARFAGTTAPAAITSLLPAPSVTTDKDDYAPGETATITASGFDAGATVTFEVDHVDGPGDDGVYGTADDETVDLGGDGHDPWTVTDGGEGDLDGVANGTIVTEWHVNPDDSLDERFVISASDGENTATNTFTDGHLPEHIFTDPLELTNPSTFGEVNDLWIAQGRQVGTSSGTGVIDSFVRLAKQGKAGFEEGINGDFRPVEFDEKTDANFTDSLLLEDIPIRFAADIDINGDGIFNDFNLDPTTTFYELRLDLNQTNANSFISLEAWTIYLGNAPDLTGFDSQYATGTGFGANSLFVYNMDGDIAGVAQNDPDTYVILNAIESGSGDADYLFYLNTDFVDDALTLAGDPSGFDWFYLYSAFGGDVLRDNEDDFELTLDVDVNDDGDSKDSLEAAAGDTVSITGNSNFEEWNIIKEPKISISGVKFEDLDADGVKDAGEVSPGEAFTVNLYRWFDTDGEGDVDESELIMLDTTETDAITGAYSFDGLGPLPDGTFYLVREEGETDWIQSFPVPNQYIIDPSTEEDSTGNDFGNYQQATKSGIKYEDFNADGVFNGSDAGLIGWTITAFADLNGDGLLTQNEIDAGAADSDVTDGTGRLRADARSGQVHRGRDRAGRLVREPRRRHHAGQLRRTGWLWQIWLRHRAHLRPGRQRQRLRQLPAGDQVGHQVRGFQRRRRVQWQRCGPDRLDDHGVCRPER